MLRVVARRFGPPETVLAIERSARPRAVPSGVVVRMLASAINPSDLLTVSGVYLHRTPLPFIPGFEGVGAITELGPGVADLRVGQRVLPLGSAGGWQTFKAVPAEWCVPVPDDLTDDQASLAYVNPLSARLMLRSIAPAPGALIGVNAAASAIGRILVRLLHAAGARPVAIVRSPKARALLESEPVSEIVTEGAPLPSLDSGLDAVGGVGGAELGAAIKPGGTLLHYGLLSGEQLYVGAARQSAIAVRMFWLRNWVHSASRAQLQETMVEVFGDIRTGRAETAVEARYALIEVNAALAHNARADRAGKVLLIPT